MAILFSGRPSRLKPVRQRLGASALAQGLLLYVSFDQEGSSNVAFGYNTRDLVSGKPFSGSSVGAQSFGELGPVINNPTTDPTLQLCFSQFAYPVVFADPDRLSIGCRVRAFGSGGSGGRQTIYSPDNAANGVQLEIDEGTNTFTVNTLIAGTFVCQTSSTGPSKKWLTIVYVRRGAGATHEVWIDGVKATLSTNLTTDYANVGAQIQRVGGRSNGTPSAQQAWLGQIEYTGIWNRDLLPTEIIDLTLDPYQVLQAAPRRRFVAIALSISGSGGAAAPVGSVQGAGSENISGSGGVSAPAGTVQGSGTEADTGAGGVSAPTGSLSGTGTVTAAHQRVSQLTAQIANAGTQELRESALTVQIANDGTHAQRVSDLTATLANTGRSEQRVSVITVTIARSPKRTVFPLRGVFSGTDAYKTASDEATVTIIR